QFVGPVELAAAGRGQLRQKVLVGRLPEQFRIVLVNQEAGHRFAGDGGSIDVLARAADDEAVFARLIRLPQSAALAVAFAGLGDGLGRRATGRFDANVILAFRQVDAGLAAHADRYAELAAGRQSPGVGPDPDAALAVLLVGEPDDHLLPELGVQFQAG